MIEKTSEHIAIPDEIAVKLNEVIDEVNKIAIKINHPTPPDKLREEIAGAVARGWCSPENADKVMDPDLVEAITNEIMRELSTR